MTTITGRLKLLSTEESHKAGNYDAETLLVAFRKANEGEDAASLLADTLNGIMALAFDNRTEESINVLTASAQSSARCWSVLQPLRRSAPYWLHR